MAGFYRDGILVSADVQAKLGRRTLTGATQEQIWNGTATERPTPAGEQLRLVSTSAEDDQTMAQSGTIVIGGTMDQAVADEYEVQLAGAVEPGDILRLTLNGANFDTFVDGGATLASLVAEAANGATLGTLERWLIDWGGTVDVGDTARITIDGVDYDAVSTLGTAAEIANLLVTAINAGAGDPHYTAAQVPPAGSGVGLVAKVRGVGPAPAAVWTVDAGSDATVTPTQNVIGIAGQADWTCTDDGVDKVICTNATPGATADTVAANMAVDNGAATTFTAVHTVTGLDADVLAVDDGTTVFSRTVASAVLNDEVAALAALINADPAYSAAAVGATITVTAAVPGVPFTFVDVSTDNQNLDLSVVIDNTAVLPNGDGPGVRQVQVDYLDANGVQQAELVDLDGLTPVLTTATDVTAILGVSSTEVGANGGAAGQITVTDVGNTKTFDQLEVGANEAPAAVYVVPARKKFWLRQVQASASAATTVRCLSSYNPITKQVVAGGVFTLAEFLVGAAPAAYEPANDVGPIPAGAKVWLTAQGAGNPVVSAVLHGYQAPAV